MQDPLIRVLLVDAEEGICARTRARLSETVSRCGQQEWVRTYEAAHTVLREGRHDVCLLHSCREGRGGIDFLRLAAGSEQAPPILLLTNRHDRNIAMTAMEAGAADCLVTTEIDAPLLERSLHYAIERKRTMEAIQAEMRRQAAIVQIQQEIMAAGMDLQAVMDLASDRLMPLTGAAGAGIGIVVGDDLVYQSGAGIAERFIGVSYPLSGSLGGTCARTGKMLYWPGTETDTRVNRSVIDQMGLQSVIAAPLGDETGIVGVLAIMSPEKDAFGPSAFRALEMIVGFVGAALKQSTLYTAKQKLLGELTQAMEAREESEKQYRALFDSARDAVTITDDTGRYVDANPAACELFGVSRDVLLASCVTDYATLEVRDQINADWQQFIDHAQYIEGEFILVRPDGERRYVDFKAKAGFVPGLHQCILRDTTMRKQAEDALRESERFARSTVEALSTYIIILDEEGKTVAVNQAWRDVYYEIGGKSRDGFEGVDYFKLCESLDSATLKDCDDVFQGIRQMLRQEIREFSLEYSCHTPTGPRWYSVHVTRFPGDGPLRVVVAHEDITKRMQMEHTIREFAAIVESSHDAIIGNDLEGRVTSWNRGAERTYGYSADEIIGRPFSLLFTEEQADESARFMEQIRRGEGLSDYEAIRRRKDGRLIQISATLSPTRSPSGEIVGTAIIARDVTENKRLQAQLAQSEKLAAMGELVSGVAHEINNPLTAILYNAESLEMHADPEVREDAAAIHRMTDRVTRIVRSLLSFARDNHEERGQCSIGGLIDTTLEICNYGLARKNVELRVNLAEHLPDIYVNGNQIQQVLLNLINNAAHALQAKDGDRTIVISADTLPSAGVEWARITVEDSGCGMPDSVRERIFDPFFTTKDIGEGTGLGLSICHGFITAHGGSISVESVVGEGTVFTVLLPTETEE